MNSYSQVPEAQGVFAPGFHGDGSGLQMKVNELRATGQTFNLVQLLECTSADTGYIEFKLELWFRTLNSEINYGTMQCLKPPGLGCEYGLFRYDPGHPLNIPGRKLSLCNLKKQRSNKSGEHTKVARFGDFDDAADQWWSWADYGISVGIFQIRGIRGSVCNAK
jgi:hypothetical protein